MTLFLGEILHGSEWNDLIAHTAGNHLLQSWGWGELKAGFGWDPLRLVASDGVHRAVAQVLFRRMAGLSVAYVPRGPLWSGDPIVDRLLLKGLRRVSLRRRAAFLRLEPNVLEGSEQANALHSALQVAGFDAAEPLQPRTSIHLDLTPAPAALLAAATKGHRADVRRAERTGVTVRVGQNQTDLTAFYRIMEATSARADFAIHSLEYYTRAYHEMSRPSYGEGGAARLFLAEKDGAVVAAFMVFAWGDEGQYMYSGANDVGLKSGANHLLQWHAIQWVRERGCRRYDLWGVPPLVADLEHVDGVERETLESMIRSDPLYGPYRFKKGWGGHVVRYLPAYDQVYIPPAYWWWKRHRAHA